MNLDKLFKKKEKPGEVKKRILGRKISRTSFISKNVPLVSDSYLYEFMFL